MQSETFSDISVQKESFQQSNTIKYPIES